jgi:hypothetical protein
VPLDYHHPGGRKISIAVARHLATDPARRLGSLFINGGGPGSGLPGSGVTSPAPSGQATAPATGTPGPWNRTTAHTILLAGITGDAALPYQGDLAMEHDLNNPSTCAMNYELSYLQTGALARAGTVCKEDTSPFPGP